MSIEKPEDVPYSDVGGLQEQIREIREVIELPLTSPELFLRVGIKPPKGVLLYGPPGTGKTLLARAIASNVDAKFLKVVSSAIVDKYIGESARVIREMFGYAKDHQPCIIFMDEIDAIGGRRFSEGTSADREIQRTLMEVRTCVGCVRLTFVNSCCIRWTGLISSARSSLSWRRTVPVRHRCWDILGTLLGQFWDIYEYIVVFLVAFWILFVARVLHFG